MITSAYVHELDKVTKTAEPNGYFTIDWQHDDGTVITKHYKIKVTNDISDITPISVSMNDGANTAWQPIETAPKDGRDVLLYDAEPPITKHNRIYIGCWFEPANDWIIDEANGIVLRPTHWHELPEPPLVT